MRRLTLLALAWLALLPSPAAASGLTFIPPGSEAGAAGGPYIYSWRLGGIGSLVPAGQVITSATLFFDDYEDSDGTAQKLFVQLLDTSTTLTRTLDSGGTQTLIRQTLYQAIDTPGSPASSSYGFSGSPGVRSWVSGPGGSFLPAALSTYTYKFSDAQVADLLGYISSGGDVAFALDPGSAFFTDGVRLLLTTSTPSSVPEPASLVLFGAGLTGLYIRRRRKRTDRA